MRSALSTMREQQATEPVRVLEERATPVSVRSLSYTYGEGRRARSVLEDVSFDIQDGEIVVLTGRSGSGKTTLLTILGALRSFTSGVVIVNGVALRGQTPGMLQRVRQRIGFVFQRHNLIKSLNVLENVESGLHLLPESDTSMNHSRAHAMLAELGLASRSGDYPAQLSGGEQQRVAVARALVRMPDLIIADEPTAALDAVNGRAVVDLIGVLAHKLGCAVILATHDERVFDIADTRLHMEDGILVRI